MAQMEREEFTPEQLCRQAVDQLRSQHGWALLPRDEFAGRAAAHLRDGTATTAMRAAIHTYCLALYTACSGAEGTTRQNQGYEELFRYLYSCAQRRHGALAGEMAQEAIERVFIGFERCRKPGAFLAFALQQLLDAARARRTDAARQPQSLATPIGSGDATLSDLLVAFQADPEGMVLAAEVRMRFERVIAVFLLHHRRAHRQIAALLLKYLHGLDDETISQQLGVSIKSVYELRARAVARLRANPDLRRLATDLGLLSEDV